MESAFSLDKVFYEQINEKMTSLGYKYIRKYKMFMKVTNDILLKYFFIEKYPAIKKGDKSFMLTGNVRSIYADSFERNELKNESMRNNIFVDIDRGFKNGYPKHYDCSIDQAKETLTRAFADAQEGILGEMEKINSFDEYIHYCHMYNYRQILCAPFYKDSLALIVANDHNNMEERLNKTCMAYEESLGKEYVRAQYSLFVHSFIELVAGERDKVYNNPVLYKEALEEAERRKEANTQTLMTLKLI